VELACDRIELDRNGGRCDAYRVDPVPARARLPGVLLIQEIWGNSPRTREAG
jgi:dienelactone hydrolase